MTGQLMPMSGGVDEGPWVEGKPRVRRRFAGGAGLSSEAEIHSRGVEPSSEAEIRLRGVRPSSEVEVGSRAVGALV
jgi:hypothetical protein